MKVLFLFVVFFGALSILGLTEQEAFQEYLEFKQLKASSKKSSSTFGAVSWSMEDRLAFYKQDEKNPWIAAGLQLFPFTGYLGLGYAYSGDYFRGTLPVLGQWFSLIWLSSVSASTYDRYEKNNSEDLLVPTLLFYACYFWTVIDAYSTVLESNELAERKYGLHTQLSVNRDSLRVATVYQF